MKPWQWLDSGFFEAQTVPTLLKLITQWLEELTNSFAGLLYW